MRTNVKTKTNHVTHEGAPAKRINAELELRRSVMACLLWEDQFYESGEDIADRIRKLVPQVDPAIVSGIILEAKNKMKLRHMPLFLTVLLLNQYKGVPSITKRGLGDLVYEVVQRPDEIAELIAMYWKENPDAPLPNQLKIGLARAFHKFDEYGFAKYNRDGQVKLRDAMFLVHPKPKTEKETELFKKIANKQLAIPDTWEVNLSAGKDKKETFTRLLQEKKLGGLAFLRNLRNMVESNVDTALIKSYFQDANFGKVLPFRFISAARYAPKLEAEIQDAMLKSLGEFKKLSGKTVIIVDNSGSMYGTKVSSRSELDRSDAACALAILVREVCEEALVISYSDKSQIVPTARRGFALAEAIKKATPHGSTNTRGAVHLANVEGYDRIIVITDEQSDTVIPNPYGDKAYFINVANYKNGIGYGKYTHIDGFSESILDYIYAAEQ